MLKQGFIILILGAALPALAQVDPAAEGGAAAPDEGLRMSVPPPASGMAYPTLTGGEERSNYLRGGLSVGTAYIDNAFSGQFSRPLHETTITVAPQIALDRTTPRFKEKFSYNPGFTFYRPTDELDAIDQNASAELDYNFARYTALRVTDNFLQTTNLLGQSAPFSVGGEGSQFLLVPFAEQISNSLQGTFSHQYARNQMFGFGGGFSVLSFPDSSQANGVYDSKQGSGSGFYVHRFGAKSYLGASYEYTHVMASPPTGESTTTLHSILPYYTVYLSPTISLSLAAGPQHYSASATGTSTSSGWMPVVSASIGSQTVRTNFSLDYTRTVSGGGGLLGAYKQDAAALAARARVTRDWALGLSGRYSNYAVATPQIVNGNQGGHSISGRGFVQRSWKDRFLVEAGYERLHQQYTGIPLIASNPDSNRGYILLTYQFSRALGR